MKNRWSIILAGIMAAAMAAGCANSSPADESSVKTGSIALEESSVVSTGEASESSKAESKTESKSESKAESKAESKTESKAESKEESKAEASLEASTESKEESKPESKAEESKTESEAASSVPDKVSEPSQEEPEQPSAVESQQEAPSTGGFSAADMSFVCNGVSVKPTDSVDVLSGMGTPDRVDTAPSCIGVGEDKIYTFGDVSIETYPDPAGEKVLNITVTGNGAATSKGIRTGMTYNDIIAAYGTSGMDSSQSDEYFVTYPSEGKLHLDFLLDGGKIVEIDYVFDVS